MSRERLASLRGKLKRKVSHVFLDGYVEVVGDTVHLFTRSHRLSAEMPGFLKRDFRGSSGQEMLEHCFPGSSRIEVYGPFGEYVETGAHDQLVREAVEDEDMQRIVKALGGQIVAVRPLRGKRGKKS